MIFAWAVGLILSVLVTFYYGTLLFEKATRPGVDRRRNALYTALFALFILVGVLAIMGFAGLLVMSLGSLWV